LIRKGLIDHMKLVLKQANHLNAHHLTVHPLNPPSFRRADNLEDTFQMEHQSYFKEVLIENLTKLTEASGSVLIMVENYQLGRITNASLSQMFQKGTDIFLTLDWAKMHTPGLTIDEDQHSFYEKHRQRIRELHLHDMDGNGRSHLGPGQGALDFEPLFMQFYDPSQWLTIEVRPLTEAVKAKGRFLEMIGKMGGT
jgi:sugar phosphate isomerase/epimerase